MSATALAAREVATRQACGSSAPAFPRTGVYFIAQQDLPSAQTLAGYDLVVIDSEWDNRLPRSFFTRIRELNPQVTLLAYANVVDFRPRLGSPVNWADRYAFGRFENSVEHDFPRQWLARTSEGTVVSEWPETLMTNLTDQAPRADGQEFAEYAAEWVAGRVYATGVWDGVFIDVWGDRIYGATEQRWDVDGDGTDEAEAEIYGPGGPWERGVNATERIMRERMPDAVLVANGDRTLRDEQLDGRVWESFADPKVRRSPAQDLEEYVTLTAEGDHRQPGTAITINRRRAEPVSGESFRRARFFLTATLLQNGYWAPMGAHYGQPAYYDEMDGAGLGRGYLGCSLAPNPTWSQLQQDFDGRVGRLADGLYRRDFEHGLVLHNAGAQPRTITLERPYRQLEGTQDSGTNSGRVVDSVTVPSRDGLILLRAES